MVAVETVVVACEADYLHLFLELLEEIELFIFISFEGVEHGYSSIYCGIKDSFCFFEVDASDLYGGGYFSEVIVGEYFHKVGYI